MLAIREGLDKQGVQIDPSYKQGEKYDFALCWSNRLDPYLRDFWAGPTLYAEVGYIHTLDHFPPGEPGYRAHRAARASFSWGGKHGLGFEYLPASVPSDRYEALGLPLRPWRFNPDGEILVLGQSKFDPVAVPEGEQEAWNEKLIKPIRVAFPNNEVRFRPHPRYSAFKGNKLLDDASGARRVITFNSTAAVETVWAGIPTQVLSPISITWPVALRGFAFPEECLEFRDRQKWANKLCYRQWDMDELKAGEFWSTVRRGLCLGPKAELTSYSDY